MKAKKKAKAVQWRELQRRELGLSLRPGCRDPGYFYLVYEVSETRDIDGKPEYRERIVNGESCRLHGEGFEAFRSLYERYAQHARQHEDGLHKDPGSGDCMLDIEKVKARWSK